MIYLEKHNMETIFKPKANTLSFIRSEKLIQGYESLKCQIQGQITLFPIWLWDQVMLIIHKMHLLFNIQDIAISNM